jgi:hypothetical protein
VGQPHGSLSQPVYKPPEVVRGQVHDEKSDCYMLGAIIFEALHGKPVPKDLTFPLA